MPLWGLKLEWLTIVLQILMEPILPINHMTDHVTDHMLFHMHTVTESSMPPTVATSGHEDVPC